MTPEEEEEALLRFLYVMRNGASGENPTATMMSGVRREAEALYSGRVPPRINVMSRFGDVTRAKSLDDSALNVEHEPNSPSSVVSAYDGFENEDAPWISDEGFILARTTGPCLRIPGDIIRIDGKTRTIRDVVREEHGDEAADNLFPKPRVLAPKSRATRGRTSSASPEPNRFSTFDEQRVCVHPCTTKRGSMRRHPRRYRPKFYPNVQKAAAAIGASPNQLMRALHLRETCNGYSVWFQDLPLGDERWKSLANRGTVLPDDGADLILDSEVVELQTRATDRSEHIACRREVIPRMPHTYTHRYRRCLRQNRDFWAKQRETGLAAPGLIGELQESDLGMVHRWDGQGLLLDDYQITDVGH